MQLRNMIKYTAKAPDARRKDILDNVRASF